MEVCVPKELKWSEQVKKVWTDQYLCGIKPNTWLHSQGCRGWGHHGSSSGTVHGGGLQHHCFQKERRVSWMLGGAWPEMCRDQNSWAVSGFIQESCSSLAYLPMACNSFLKLLLPGRCESRHWLFPVGTRQASLHRQGMVTEPAEMQLGAKGLRNKHKNLSCELKDVEDLMLISVPYAPLTLIVLKVLWDFLPFSLHPTPVQVHPCCSHEFCPPVQIPQVQEWSKSPKLFQRMSLHHPAGPQCGSVWDTKNPSHQQVTCFLSKNEDLSSSLFS